VTLSINKTAVLTYAVTNQFTSGDVMLGYDDPFANNSAGSGAAVYYSNLRVVEIAPVITGISPTNLVVFEGQSASFTATATGVGPYTNVWYFGTNAIYTNVVSTTTDSSTLVVNPALGANYGSYDVVVSDASGGSVTSAVVMLVVIPPSPTFTGVGLNTNGTQVVLTFTTADPDATTNSFILQTSTNLSNTNNDGFTNTTGATFSLSNGVFTVLAPTNGAAAFYRLIQSYY